MLLINIQTIVRLPSNTKNTSANTFCATPWLSSVSIIKAVKLSYQLFPLNIFYCNKPFNNPKQLKFLGVLLIYHQTTPHHHTRMRTSREVIGN